MTATADFAMTIRPTRTVMTSLRLLQLNALGSQELRLELPALDRETSRPRPPNSELSLD